MSQGFVLKPPKPEKNTKVAAPDTNPADGNSEGYPMSKWRQEQIWIEAVDNETKALKNWNEHWSFTVDYDQRGELKSKSKLPSKVQMFSDVLPNSCGHAYGHQLKTEEAKNIAAMEGTITNSYRKRRNNSLICYD